MVCSVDVTLPSFVKHSTPFAQYQSDNVSACEIYMFPSPYVCFINIADPVQRKKELDDFGTTGYFSLWQRILR